MCELDEKLISYITQNEMRNISKTTYNYFLRTENRVIITRINKEILSHIYINTCIDSVIFHDKSIKFCIKYIDICFGIFDYSNKLNEYSSPDFHLLYEKLMMSILKDSLVIYYANYLSDLTNTYQPVNITIHLDNIVINEICKVYNLSFKKIQDLFNILSIILADNHYTYIQFTPLLLFIMLNMPVNRFKDELSDQAINKLFEIMSYASPFLYQPNRKNYYSDTLNNYNALSLLYTLDNNKNKLFTTELKNIKNPCIFKKYLEKEYTKKYQDGRQENFSEKSEINNITHLLEIFPSDYKARLDMLKNVNLFIKIIKNCKVYIPTLENVNMSNKASCTLAFNILTKLIDALFIGGETSSIAHTINSLKLKKTITEYNMQGIMEMPNIITVFNTMISNASKTIKIHNNVNIDDICKYNNEYFTDIIKPVEYHEFYRPRISNLDFK